MPSHQETRILPYTVEQIFLLVADVESYPKFLPWCVGSRILKRAENSFLAELVISFKQFRESYTSNVKLTPPLPSRNAAIDVELVNGPFEHLVNRWKFLPEEGGKCRVEFFIEFRFKSRILDMLISGFFSRATEKMVQSFESRAHALYGQKSADFRLTESPESGNPMPS
jgi:coenzyme Q-binding protein COQ10